MIYFIRGILHTIKEDSVIIDTNGTGYQIFCTITDLSSLSGNEGKEVLIYTYLVHKEDSMTLYGFVKENTKKGFLSLIKVSGIGPKQAIKILSHFNADEIFNCVQREDIDTLVAIPGIGPKMAKKIIFELKGVIPTIDEENSSPIEQDLVSALVNLGYKDTDVKAAIAELRPLDNDFEKEFKRLLKQLSSK